MTSPTGAQAQSPGEACPKSDIGRAALSAATAENLLPAIDGGFIRPEHRAKVLAAAVSALRDALEATGVKR